MGTPRIEVNRKPISFKLHKSLALLAYLAISPGDHAREFMSSFLWPEAHADRVSGYLRNVIWDINRSEVHSWLATDRMTVSLIHNETMWVDFAELEACLAWCRHPDMRDNVKCTTIETLLHQGFHNTQQIFMHGFSLRDSQPFDEWQSQQNTHVHNQLTEVCACLAHWYQQEGDIVAGLDITHHWLQLDPMAEAAHVMLMKLHVANGHLHTAVDHYRAYVEKYQETAGLHPSDEIKAYYEFILNGGQPTTYPPHYSIPHSHHLSHNKVPVPLSGFVGRRQQISEVMRHILDPDVRLLTLTGPGGVGKTRIALQVGTLLEKSFPDGVVFIPLAPLHDVDYVLPTLAMHLGLHQARINAPQSPASLQQTSWLNMLQNYLSERNILLIMDNFEHVRQAALSLNELMESAPALKILTTSRVNLNLNGECLYEIVPMKLPEEDHDKSWIDLTRVEAIQLFERRIHALRPSFQLTESNTRVIVDICQQLDGLPLAIELAVARTRLFSLETILHRLQDRLEFLKDEGWNRPQRHRSLQATMDWSYHLLCSQEQTLFRYISVFKGNFTLDAAKALVPANADLDVERSLQRLVDSSMLQVENNHGGLRFLVLETIREYATELLRINDEDHQLRSLHARYYLNLVTTADTFLLKYNAEQAAWMRRVQIDIDNIRAALQWSLTFDVTTCIKLVLAMGQFWLLSGGEQEGLQWIERVMPDIPETGSELLRYKARMYNLAGQMVQEVDHSRVADFHWQAYHLWQELDDKAGMGHSLSKLGYLSVVKQDLREAEKLIIAGVTLLEQTDSEVQLTDAYCNLAQIYLYTNEYEKARSFTVKYAELGRVTGAYFYSALADGYLGTIASHQGDYDAAETGFLSLLRAATEAGDIVLAMVCLSFLGGISTGQQQYDKAQNYYEACVQMRHTLGDRAQVGWALTGLANLARRDGDFDRAAMLYQEALKIGKKLNHEWLVDRINYNIGHTALSQGHLQQAIHLFMDSVLWAQNREETGAFFNSVAGLAGAAYQDRRPHLAAQCMGVVDQLMAFAGSQCSHEWLEQARETMHKYRDQMDPILFNPAYEQGKGLASKGGDAIIAFLQANFST